MCDFEIKRVNKLISLKKLIFVYKDNIKIFSSQDMKAVMKIINVQLSE